MAILSCVIAGHGYPASYIPYIARKLVNEPPDHLEPMTHRHTACTGMVCDRQALVSVVRCPVLVPVTRP